MLLPTSMPLKLIITAFDPLFLIASHLLVMTAKCNFARCAFDWNGPDMWCNSELPGLILFPRVIKKQNRNPVGQAIICECIDACSAPPGNVLHSFGKISTAVMGKKSRYYLRGL